MSQASEDKVYLSVEMPISGETFPNPAELKARNKIIDALDKRRIGKFIGAGGGMGAMDFSYVVSDEEAARAAIAEAVAKYLPGVEYTVEVGSADDIDVDDDDDEADPDDISWPKAIGCLAAMAGGVVLIIYLLWRLFT